jgi:hypothetical protein
MQFSDYVVEKDQNRNQRDDSIDVEFLVFVETVIFPLLKELFNENQTTIHNNIFDIICAVECEFQWLLCQEYSPNIFPIEELLTSNQISTNDVHTVINEYSGENVLHLLIIRGSLQAIERLHDIINGSDYRQHMMNAKVTGRFFCPVYGEVQYGQTPLHFAVCTGQIEVVKHLLKKWCPDDISRYLCLWQKDSRGNSVLHLCVLKSLTIMYDFLEFSMKALEQSLRRLEWWHLEPRLSIADDDCLKNFHYFTPIELAAIVGNTKMLAHLIGKEKMKNLGWSYGSATLNATRIRDIDSYKTLTCPREPDVLADVSQYSESRWAFIHRRLMSKIRSRNEVEPSVLSILIEKEQKQLLSIPVIQGLIDFKWMTFGRPLLICWGAVSLAIFILFEIVCYNILYPSSQAGLVHSSNIPFSNAEIALYIIATIFLLWRQYLQFDKGITMQQSDSTFATFDLDTPALSKSYLVYPSHPSWKLGAKLKATIDKQRNNLSLKTLELFAQKMLSNPFRTSQIQPYVVTQENHVRKAQAMPMSIFTKLLWRITGEGMMKEGGFFGVSWAILVLLSAAIRLALPNDHETSGNAEQVCLALASVSIFFYMTGFYSFSDKLGPFMVLLQHMFMDLAKWLSITVLFFLGYAQAMLIITTETSVSIFGTYKWLLGDSSTEDITGSEILQGVIIFLFISYSILVSISLVNILTAMFGSTYGQIMENSKETWFLE